MRNIKKLDEYPENNYDKKKGISTYFKAEYKGLYHRGIEVFIQGWQTIKQDENGNWNFCDYKDEGAVKVIPGARIPFDFISHIDWQGDEFHLLPIIFCRFDGVSSGPYEEIPFFTQEGSDDHTYFIEVENFRPWDKKEGNWFRFLKNRI